MYNLFPFVHNEMLTKFDVVYIIILYHSFIRLSTFLFGFRVMIIYSDNFNKY